MKTGLSTLASFLRGTWATHSEWFMREWKYLLVSLGIAIVVFFLVQGEVIHETTLRIPVRMADYSEGLRRRDAPIDIEATPSEREVNVSFRGDSGELAALGSGASIEILVPYPSQRKLDDALAGDGMVEVALRRGFVHGARAREARPVRFEPPSVSIMIDESAEAPFKVEATLTGTPATNHVVDARRDLQFVNEAMVRGPKSRIKSLGEAGVVLRTDPIDLEGRAQNFETRVKIRPPVDVPEAKIDPPEVTVKVTVSETADSQSMIGEISNVPVRVTQETGGLWASWDAEPSFVTLRVRGNTNSIDMIRSKQSRLFTVVHAEDGDDSGSEHRVWTFLPEEFRDTVQIVSVIPQSVRLRRIVREETPATPAAGPSGASAGAATGPDARQPVEQPDEQPGEQPVEPPAGQNPSAE